MKKVIQLGLIGECCLRMHIFDNLALILMKKNDIKKISVYKPILEFIYIFL